MTAHRRGQRLAAALFVATACIALAGCPSKTVQEGVKAASKDPAAPGDINATAAQCRNERDVMEKAVEAYTLLEGVAPASELAMVPDWLIAESVFMDLDAAGNIVPAPGSGCT